MEKTIYPLIFTIILTITGIHCTNPLDNLDPFSPGPLEVHYTEYLGLLTLNLDTNLDVYAPNATGSFPVLYYVVGLGGTIPGVAYNNLLRHIASHGIVIVAIWKIGNPLESFDPSWLDKTVSFIENRLENNLHNSHGYVSGFHVDYHNSFISGHSAGAHVPVVQLETHCLNFRGQILLNGVDGADPFDSIPIYSITPGQKVNYTVPTLQIVAGFDSVPGIDLDNFNFTLNNITWLNITGWNISEWNITEFPACAPEKLSGFRFFDAMNGPIWFINATDYGHGDFLDDLFVLIVEGTHFCASDFETDKDAYRDFIAGQIISFIKGISDPDNFCYLLDNLETDDLLGVQSVHQFQSNGWERCSPSLCAPV